MGEKKMDERWFRMNTIEQPVKETENIDQRISKQREKGEVEDLRRVNGGKGNRRFK